MLKDIVRSASDVQSSRSRKSDTETGPGVFESALGYTEAFRMADNGALFKLVAKSVGMKYGIIPTFMAKPWSDVRSFTSPCAFGAEANSDAWLFRVSASHRIELSG